MSTHQWFLAGDTAEDSAVDLLIELLVKVVWGGQLLKVAKNVIGVDVLVEIECFWLS